MTYEVEEKLHKSMKRVFRWLERRATYSPQALRWRADVRTPFSGSIPVHYNAFRGESLLREMTDVMEPIHQLTADYGMLSRRAAFRRRYYCGWRRAAALARIDWTGLEFNVFE